MPARKLVLLLGLLVPRLAFAETTEPGYAPFAIGVSGNLGTGYGLHCYPAMGDVVPCTSDPIRMAGVRLMPRWRGGEGWALGLFGGIARRVFGTWGSAEWWDVEAEARWYPFGAGRFEPWAAGPAGLVIAVDHLSARTPELGVTRPAGTYLSIGPSGGLGIGIDVNLAPWFAIGPEMRGFVLGLNTGDGDFSRPAYRRQVGFTVGLTLTALVVPGS